MNEKLATQLQKHRDSKEDKKRKHEKKLEEHRARRVKILGLEDRKLAMLMEAGELDSLANVARTLLSVAEHTKADTVHLKELVQVAKRLRMTAIMRWTVFGATNIEVSEAFGVSTVRVSQIRKEMLGPKKDRKFEVNSDKDN